MANSLGIIECTMAQAADISNVVNTVGEADAAPRDRFNKAATIRVTDHPADTGATGSDVEGMALFTNRYLHDMWRLGGANRGAPRTNDDPQTILPV